MTARPIFLIGTTGFWLTMMSLLVGREFFQLTPVQAPYEVLPLHNAYLREEYQAIYLGDQRIGFGYTVLDRMDKKIDKEAAADKVYEMRHQTYLSFRLLGRDTEILMKGKAGLDEQLYLKSFEVTVHSKEYWTKLKGRLSKGAMNIVIEGKAGKPERKIIPVTSPILYSEALDLIWTPENLKTGKRGHLKIWNPMSTGTEEIGFRVGKRETILYDGKDTPVYPVYLEKNGIETRSWVSPEGITLRKEGITGLLMQKEENWKIFEAMRRRRAAPPDLPNLFSVPSNRILEKPEDVNYLKINLKSPEGEKIIEVTRRDFTGLETVPIPVPAEDPSLGPYLESTPFIQAQDPDILRQAREIAGDEKTALGAALKLMRWVYLNVSPSPTVSLPSARQVLAVRKGDCTEYTVLFTALARSLGIPAKMIAGLVHRNGRFFYHAWPEIYLGRWVPVDPTFGEAPVDAAHIPLVEGGLKEQASLLANLGRLHIWVLEVK